MKATFLFLLALAFGLESCGKHVTGSKNIVEKEIHTENFTAISTLGSYNVFYTQRPGTPQVKVITSDNILDILDIYVKEGRLHLSVKPGYGFSAKKLEVHVSSESLTDIDLMGSADAKLIGTVRSPELNLTVAGSGDIEANHLECEHLNLHIAGSGEMELDDVRSHTIKGDIAGSGDMDLKRITANEVSFSIAGSGDIELKGTTQKARYQIAGSGEIDAKELQATEVYANAAGSGDISCYATELLKAEALGGSGRIGYVGNPKLEVSDEGRSHVGYLGNPRLGVYERSVHPIR